MSLQIESTRNDWNQAFMLYQGFLKLDQISELTGIPEDLLLARAKKYNWFRNRATAQSNANKGIARNLQKRIEEHKTKVKHFAMDQLDETQKVIEGIETNEENLFTKLGALEKHYDIAEKVLGLDEEQKQDPNTIGFHLLVSMSKSLVNDKKHIEIENEVETLQDPENDALRRSIPFDDKNDSKPILGVLNQCSAGYEERNGQGLASETTKSTETGQSGTEKPLYEKQELPLYEFLAKPKELKFIEP